MVCLVVADNTPGTHAANCLPACCGNLGMSMQNIARQCIPQSGKKVREKEEMKWKGLVLVHAQVDVESMYQRLGFETDDSLGRWDEEGIEHVGMFKRISLHNSPDK